MPFSLESRRVRVSFLLAQFFYGEQKKMLGINSRRETTVPVCHRENGAVCE